MAGPAKVQLVEPNGSLPLRPRETREGSCRLGERIKGFLRKDPITAVSLIILPLPESNQYLKARKKTIS